MRINRAIITQHFSILLFNFDSIILLGKWMSSCMMLSVNRPQIKCVKILIQQRQVINEEWKFQRKIHLILPLSPKIIYVAQLEPAVVCCGVLWKWNYFLHSLLISHLHLSASLTSHHRPHTKFRFFPSFIFFVYLFTHSHAAFDSVAIFMFYAEKCSSIIHAFYAAALLRQS